MAVAFLVVAALARGGFVPATIGAVPDDLLPD